MKIKYTRKQIKNAVILRIIFAILFGLLLFSDILNKRELWIELLLFVVAVASAVDYKNKLKCMGNKKFYIIDVQPRKLILFRTVVGISAILIAIYIAVFLDKSTQVIAPSGELFRDPYFWMLSLFFLGGTLILNACRIKKLCRNNKV